MSLVTDDCRDATREQVENFVLQLADWSGIGWEDFLVSGPPLRPSLSA